MYKVQVGTIQLVTKKLLKENEKKFKKRKMISHDKTKNFQFCLLHNLPV